MSFNTETESSEFDGAFKTKVSRPAGRRRQRQVEDTQVLEDGADAVPRTTKSGWGMEEEGGEDGGPSLTLDDATASGVGATSAGAKGARRRIAASDDAAPRLQDETGDGDDDMPVIPDLEEDEVDEEVGRQVAAPPRVRNSRVQTIKELDHEFKFSLPPLLDAGVDLSLLTTSLSPQDQVVEDDALWDEDSLLRELAAEFQAEEDSQLEETKDTDEVSTGAVGR